MREIESIVKTHLEVIGQMYCDTSFYDCIEKISKAHILPLFCDLHRNQNFPYMIREYIGIRYHFESKRLKNV